MRLALVFLAVFLAGLATSLLTPPVRFLATHHVPRWLATLAVLLVAVALLGLALGWIVPGAVREVNENGDELVQRFDRLVQSITAALPGDPTGLRELLDRLQGMIGENARRVAMGVATGVARTAEVLAGLALALVLTFFFLRDGERFYARGLGRLDPARRAVVGPVLEHAWGTLARWFRGAAIVALIDAIGIGLGLVIVGVPLALPLALLTFVGGFIPVVGATVAGSLAVLVAWATGGTTDALIIVAVVIGVQQLEGNVLEPFVLGRFVPLHPAVILVVLTIGALLGGVAGAFVAVPLAAAVTGGLIELRNRLAMTTRDETETGR